MTNILKNKKIERLLIIILLILPLLVIRRSLDNDIWFYLNSGRYMVNNWNSNPFITIEPFTIHDDFSFSFQKWLSSIVFYKIYSFTGPYGLIIFLYIIALLIEYLFYINLKNISNNRFINIVILSFSCSLLFFLYGVTRPQVFSYICLLLEFYCLEKYVKTSQIKFLFFLPIISLFYIQFHSTMWIMFFIMLMPYWFDFNFIQTKIKCEYTSYHKWPIYIFSLLSFLVGFINPYGITSILFIFNTLDINVIDIKELAIPSSVQLIAFSGLYMPTLLYLVISTIDNVNKNKINNTDKIINIPLRYLYIIMGLFILGLMAIRNIVYLTIYSAMIFSYILKDISINNLAKYFSENFIKIINNIYKYILTIFMVIICIFMFSKDTIYSSTAGYDAINYFDNYIKENDINKNNLKVFTDFNCGGYCEWLGYKCYLDARGEVFTINTNKKKNILKEMQSLQQEEISIKTFQSTYNFNYWIIPLFLEEKLNLKNNNLFKLLYEDNSYLIFKVV